MQRTVLLLAVAAAAFAQLPGSNNPETHPPLSWETCSKGGSCVKKEGKLVIDANWRWLHVNGQHCYRGNTWVESTCKDVKSCAQCTLDGAKYKETYGVEASGSDVKLNFITKHQYGVTIGSRLYLMENDEKYQMFSLLNKEFAFDVDMSNTPCGLNTALYFVSMDADGGKSKYPGNKAGAKYGVGYCDAQCARDIKFINGEANVANWTGSKSDQNAGVGGWGSCCAEMDIWEANRVSTALTTHPCTTSSQTRCDGDKCGGTYSKDRYAGICDPDGCDFNAYRMGDKDFYGVGKKVDTKKKMTVVTQFIGEPLREIKRIYVQDGKVIENAESKIPGVKGNSLTPAFCAAQKKAFGETPWNDQGGFEKMSEALKKGMVLVLSLWDDHAADMQWLDGKMKRPDGSMEGPGVERGTCPLAEGKPEYVEAKFGSASVTFSNIKFGEIGSTFKGASSAKSQKSDKAGL